MQTKADQTKQSFQQINLSSNRPKTTRIAKRNRGPGGSEDFPCREAHPSRTQGGGVDRR